MKRTLLSLLVAGLFAVAGTSAMAQNVTPEDQQKAEAKPATPTATKEMKSDNASSAADSTAKADYTAAKAKAQTEYKDTKAKCDKLKGDAMRTCTSDAKAARSDALAMAKTEWEKQQ